MAKKNLTGTILRRTRLAGARYAALRRQAEELKATLADVYSRMQPWTTTIDILREELTRAVKSAGGSAEVWGPHGIGSSVTIYVKPRKGARTRYLTVRPDGIGTAKFCFKIVSDEDTGTYQPNTIGAINGLNFREAGEVTSATQLLIEMERRHKAPKRKTKIGGKP